MSTTKHSPRYKPTDAPKTRKVRRAMNVSIAGNDRAPQDEITIIRTFMEARGWRHVRTASLMRSGMQGRLTTIIFESLLAEEVIA